MKNGLRQTLMLALILVSLSAVLEFVISNYTFFFMGDNRNVQVEYCVEEIEGNINITISDIDIKVRNIELDYLSIGQLIKYNVSVVLDGYSYAGVFNYNQKWERVSKNVVINTNCTDEVKKIVIVTPAENYVEPSDIVLNSTKIRFKAERFIFIGICGLVIFYLKKSCCIYEYDIRKLSGCLVVIASTLFLLFLSFEQGVIGGVVRYTYLDGNYYDDYSELTNSFLNRSVNFINIIPSEDFLALENYYDYTERDVKGVAYPFDGNYYNGAFSTYFGVTPVFELMIPSYYVSRLLGTEKCVISTFSATLVYLMTIIISFGILLPMLMQKLKLKPSKTEYILIYNGVLICSGFLQLLRGLKYDLAVASGIAHTLVAFILILSLDDYQRKNRIKFFFIGLCMGLMVLSKPSFIFAYILLLYMLREWITKRNIKELCLGGIPLGICAIFQMWYNFKRYGSVIDFGYSYMVGANMEMFGKISILKAIKNILAGVITPPELRLSEFPYLFEQIAVTSSDLNCISICDTVIGLAYIPILWILLFRKYVFMGTEEKHFLFCSELVAILSFSFAFSKVSINDEYLIGTRFLLVTISVAFWLFLKQSSQQKELIGKIFMSLMILSIAIMLPCSITNHVSLLSSFNGINVMIRGIFEFWN